MGLQDLHQKNIVHRDIKLENILMSSLQNNFQAKIADFGSATILPTADSKARLQIGTNGYFAPEILKAEEYGKEVDIYSLGALTYALLTAKLPFWDADTDKKLYI